MDDQAVYRLFRHSDWLLADGAIGTNLFARGLPPGTAPERWNLDHPEQVTALHRAFVEAGADIILTNSFGANRRRLELLGETDVQSINLQAAQLAGGAAQSSERDVVIAGSIGPSGSLLQPYGELSRNEAEALFDEQARALAEGGVDCLWIETMAAGDELSAAFNAAAGTGLPVVCTFSFDMHGHTMMGLDVGAALDVIGELPQTPLALGANCGGGTLDTVEIIVQMHEQLDDSVPIVAKANCGQPRFHDGVIDYGKSPEHMAHYARLARDAGARIIGGCCGTGAQHLQAMSRALQDYRPQPYDGQQAQALLGE